MASSSASSSAAAAAPRHLLQLQSLTAKMLESWQASVAKSHLAKAYPTLYRKDPALIEEMLTSFWEVLSTHVEREIDELAASRNLAEKFRELDAIEKAVKDAEAEGGYAPLAVPPADEMRNHAGDAKTAYIKQLEDLLASTRAKNDDMEKAVKAMHSKATTIRKELAASIEVFRKAAESCEMLTGAEGGSAVAESLS